MKVLVIGGTQFIGRPLVSALLKAGHDVTVLHRKPEHDFGKKVGNIQADRNNPEEVRRALAGHQFEAVFDNVYDWQRGTTAAQVEAMARACGNNLERYVFMSSVSAYGDGLNPSRRRCAGARRSPRRICAQQSDERAHTLPDAPAPRPSGRDDPARLLYMGQAIRFIAKPFSGTACATTAPSSCPATAAD